MLNDVKHLNAVYVDSNQIVRFAHYDKELQGNFTEYLELYALAWLCLRD